MALETTAVLFAPAAVSARDRLVGRAAALLSERAQAAAFVRDLFGRVAPDDLGAYPSRALAALAAGALDRLAEPAGEEPRVWLTDVSLERDGRFRDVTIVEAVNPNRAHLLDSALAELERQGLSPDLVAHPILGVERAASGVLIRVVGETTANASGVFPRESFIHIHVDRLYDDAARRRLADGLRAVFEDVARASQDQEAMRLALAAAAERLRTAGGPDAAESAAFLEWFDERTFTLLGTVGMALEGPGPDPLAVSVRGILRGWTSDALLGLFGSSGSETASSGIAVGRIDALSRVRRSTRLDRVAVGTAPNGIGTFHAVGLFTEASRLSPVGHVPHLRGKVAEVLSGAGLDPTSHAGRNVVSVLDGYPRDDLYQIEADRLLRFAVSIADLADRPRVRVLARTDRSGTFASVLVYVFRDRYDSIVAARIGEHLAKAYEGRLCETHPDLPEGLLARTRYVIALPPGRRTEPTPLALEAEVAAISRTWADGLHEALSFAHDGRTARALADRYADAFSVGYRDRFTPGAAVVDIGIIETLSPERLRAVDIGRRLLDEPDQIRLQIFSRGTSIPLSDRVPALENLGFKVIDERTYHASPRGVDEPPKVWIHDMLLERAAGGPVDLDMLADPLKRALLAMSDGSTETDGFNRLVLEAGLEWRDAALMRALGRYLRQLCIRYGQDYIAATLAAHPALSRSIVELFHVRFDPKAAEDRDRRQSEIRAAIERALLDVANLDEDRILRRFVNLIEAAVRTNAFQTSSNGKARETTSIKFVCAKVAYMPLPRPLFEIFVYSPRVEGVHLRYGYVARGGLRWSDRPEDYRTEVLGLVKAQQVKNAVIVPVGAKGGFLPKRLPPASDRTAWLQEGTAAYRIFVGALLDLTDNLVEGAIVPPTDSVLHDGSDAYLVVAADKGTATFSDVANAISAERGHWLGDAFASGGSVGYDHKAMGITARGAWEAVKRHFAEMDVDIATDAVEVVGVGDMSGDVFGNGMLLSDSLRLVAAFDHRHVFIDPTPDAKSAFRERRRLFSLGRSTWDDYDRSLISAGGGVYPRSMKAIPVGPEARTALGFDGPVASPHELMQAILKAPVGLLWFGGIGTYVRAGSESDDAAGDRANDAVRIVGSAIRAKVVGEGANLALTQRGRIEAARSGVRLNTDAIDNSAGVNTSDLEVNIKIALMAAERGGRLDSAARSALLAEMTDEVAALVLCNNASQTLALSLAEDRGLAEAASAMRVMRALERDGRLDRSVEFLPSDVEIVDRMKRGDGFVRPELSVLMAYVKLSLYDAILDGAAPEEPYFERELDDYFPAGLKERFPEAVAGHRLRREIVSTALSNGIVNDGGPWMVNRIVEDTGADAATIVRAYAIARDVFDVAGLKAAIDGLAPNIPGRERLGLHGEVRDLLEDGAVWFVRNVDLSGAIGAEIDAYREGVAAVVAALPYVLGPPALEALIRRTNRLEGLGMVGTAVRILAAIGIVSAALDIVRVAKATGCTCAEAALVYLSLGSVLRLDAFTATDRTSISDVYDRSAMDQTMARISRAHARLAREILAESGTGAQAVDAWIGRRSASVFRLNALLQEVLASGLTLSRATVAASVLAELGGSSDTRLNYVPDDGDGL